MAIVLIATGVGAVPASAQVNAATPPRLLDVRVTSPAVLTPGQSLTIDFTLSRAADYVEFSVDGLESPEYLRATSGPVSGPGPFTGRAVLPVDADQGHLKWSGAYSITRVRVGYAKAFLGYLNGQEYWYYATADYARDGSCQQSEAGYCLPGYAYGTTTTLTVDAPAYRLSDNANVTPPAIVGTPGYGETIQLVDATWAAGHSGRKTYLRDGVPLGTDHPDWVVEEDIGHDLSVHLESFAEGYRPAAATSAPVRITSPISASPARLTGRAVVGQTVTAAFDESSVAVTPPQPFTVAYKLNYAPATPDQLAHTLAARDAGRQYRFEAMVTTTGTPSAQRPFSATTPGIVRFKAAGEGFDAGFAPDLFARDAAGRLLLYPTDGVGRWLPARTIGVGWNVFDLVLNVGDFDGDGNGDVLARDTSGNLFLYPGDGHGDWLPRRQIGWGWNECGAIIPVGDFDSDGINDLLCRATDGRLVFFPGQGDGTFRPVRSYSVNRLHTGAFPGWSNPLIGEGWNSLGQVFSPGDFDGDGRNDVLARDAAGQLLLFRGDGKGGWVSDRATVVGWGWGGMARIGGAGDFDGDGAQDVWTVDGAGQLLVYFGNGRGGWRGSAVVGTGWSGFTSVF